MAKNEREEKCDRAVTVSLTPTILETLDDLAWANRQTRSAYVRRLVVAAAANERGGYAQQRSS